MHVLIKTDVQQTRFQKNYGNNFCAYFAESGYLSFLTFCLLVGYDGDQGAYFLYQLVEPVPPQLLRLVPQFPGRRVLGRKLREPGLPTPRLLALLGGHPAKS